MGILNDIEKVEKVFKRIGRFSGTLEKIETDICELEQFVNDLGDEEFTKAFVDAKTLVSTIKTQISKFNK